MGAHSIAAWIAAFFLASSLFSGTVALRLLLLFAGAALCAWVAFRDRTVRKLPPLWIPFGLWAAWSAATLLWSVDPDRSAKELRNEIVYTGLAFWMCYVAAQAPRAGAIILGVLAPASAAACTVALYYFGRDYWEYPFGAHGGSGNHSSVLLTLMPFAILTVVYGFQGGAAKWILPAAASLALLYAASAYGTLNRTIWIGIGLQVIVIILLTQRRASKPDPGRGAIVALALLVLAIGGAAMLWKVQANRAVYGNVAIEKDLRLTVWPEAIERIREKPVVGYGFGRGVLRQELTRDANSNVAWHSHNLFLDTLLQSGAIGLALLLGLLGATVRHGWILLNHREPLVIAYGIAAIALVVGMLVRNMTDVLWVRHIALLYWGCLGVLFAWGHAQAASR